MENVNPNLIPSYDQRTFFRYLQSSYSILSPLIMQLFYMCYEREI